MLSLCTADWAVDRSNLESSSTPKPIAFLPKSHSELVYINSSLDALRGQDAEAYQMIERQQPDVDIPFIHEMKGMYIGLWYFLFPTNRTKTGDPSTPPASGAIVFTNCIIFD
ncbi:hypothetical protein PRIPAC_92478 [Pristionchus pacificus]|uniref:Uncharacterized protein n=1 Tax=Pristionchus pacificus TaxID=54126 RepID=A0A2A6B9X9_PRIPA|nr:hypothetical protein PRIPAC_92478 [Pristionchus pacificus]|eukprot:PDM62692.1 hypothetical protein PRIPAC_49907 [Pristionchus pacificus]